MMKKEAILKTEQGQYVTYKQTSIGWTLSVVEKQNSQVGKYLWIVRENKERAKTFWAFVWNIEESFYSPKVTGDKLKLEKLDAVSDSEFAKYLSNSNLFEKTGHGDYYGLVPYGKEKQRLSLSNKNELQISDDETKWITIMDKDP